MIQEDNNYLRNTMQDADMKELFPEFNKEREWAQLSAKLKSNNKRIPLHNLLKAAAIFLILISIGGYIWYASSGTKKPTSNQIVSTPLQAFKQLANSIDSSNKKIAGQNNLPDDKIFADNSAHKPPRTHVAVLANARATEPICNATKCAIEICIYQTIHCGDGIPSEIADCRTIEPDQSGQLNYETPGNMGKDCHVTIDEIRIKKVSTGETIVINAGTEPASAQEMFQCFTGETRCDILAGMFNTGCNDDKPRQLKIGSSYGDIIIE